MEEGSEAHMETDVSSTTEDVPETQEVTDSAGNVEMVIVVETLSEEESYSSSHSEKQLSPVDNDVNTEFTASEGSYTVDKEPNKSPTKSIVSGNEISKSSSTSITPQKPSNKVCDINEAQTSSHKQNINNAKVQSIEVADSSVVDSTPLSIAKISSLGSPAKELQKPTSSKEVQKTPPKDTTTPIKVLIKTPSKESIKSPQKELLKTPLKEMPKTPIKDVPKTPTKALELTPTKELIITSTEDVEMTAKDDQKTPVKEAVKSPLKEASSLAKERKTPVKEVQRTLLKDSEKSPSKENVLAPSEPQSIPTESQKTVTEVSQGDPSTTDAGEILQNNDIIVNGELGNGKPSDSPMVKTSTVNVTLVGVIEKDVSNNSQLEANVDATEKEPNKGISRELKSLIKSAKESKIISECTQLKSKTRKSRTGLDTSANLNSSTDAEKIHNRRISDNSQNSNCSEKSDKSKRSMRSQNPEFVSKVKQFLNNVTKGHKDSEDESESEDLPSGNKPEQSDSTSTGTPKVKKTDQNDKVIADKNSKLRSDPYCWRCHWAIDSTNEKGHTPMVCTVCPRSYHYKCLSSSERTKIIVEKNWVCPECMLELQAESSETRSYALKKISLGMLCDLLKHALDRLMDLNGVEPFMQPVDRAVFPEYDKYVVHPMDLNQMKSNIAAGQYGSTEAFLADAQWILHNSIIFNTLQSKLTAAARALVRSCRAEMGEIEACPQCYGAAHSRRSTWFTDVCTTPHMLLWAKLKGFPYWPAKGMSVNNGQVDVRFFGAHDRAWVPAKDCFLYSEKDPNNFRTKRQDILDSMQEAEQHIRNISRKYGKFVYPPFKTQFDPSKLAEQLKMMIPDFDGEIKTPVSKEKTSPSPFMSKEKRRSHSKSSKSSTNDGESENDELPAKTRKMADGAEIAQEEPETNKEKSNDIMEVDATPIKPKELSRKRRRSELEEAVITIIETSTGPDEKRRRLDDKAQGNKSEKQDLSTQDNKTKPKEKAKSTTQESNTTTDKDNNETNSDVSSIKQKEKQRVTPIRISLGKEKRVTRRASISIDSPNKITPNKDSEKVTPQRPRSAKPDRTPGDKSSKEDKKAEKRRNSRNNKSLLVPRTDKAAEKLSDKAAEKLLEKTDAKLSEKKDAINKEKPTNASKDKSKENTAVNKEKEFIVDKTRIEKQRTASPKVRTNSPKSVKDRLHFDDDTTLAVIARQTAKTVLSGVNSGMPTISSVCSLSTTATTTATTNSKTTTNPRMIEVSIEASSNSGIFSPTVTDSVRNSKDVATKSNNLRNETEPLVGRVGVRAFARMTSPDRSPEKNDGVQVEIKAEPIDLDEADRQTEKLDLMNSFRLRPVNPTANTSTALREVRINKVAAVAPPQPRKPAPAKPVETRPRAKKTFPQTKKPDEGLNGKNSMVYIPIQPPSTGAPPRPPRPAAPTVPIVPSGVRLPAPGTSPGNPIVNTVTTPVMQVSSLGNCTSATCTPTSSTPAIGQVHTVPLMTSVNGQWMFSFQPVMSVGALDSTSSGAPPVMNGTMERPPGIVSLVGNNTRPADTNTPGEPPRLQQRPPVILMNPLDTNTPANPIPTPSTAGTLTAKLNQNAVKLADFFRTVLEDTIEKVDDPSTLATALKLQMEQMRWKHQQELDELKHNTELRLSEVRASFEKEKIRLVNEVRRSSQQELEAAIKTTKAKQWCANCSAEAQFYCCWNTSYCDYPCQRSHWAQHHSVCAQQRQDGSSEPPSSPESRLQPQPDKMPKNGSTPTLTVGGKVVPSRPANVDKTRPDAPSLSTPQKTSLIVSMVEDKSGNKTMKCLGTYKPPQTMSSQMSPVILNKQIMNNEENANKKVMTSSGGYLIVGASGQSNSPVVMTPNRRTHTIQQIT